MDTLKDLRARREHERFIRDRKKFAGQYTDADRAALLRRQMARTDDVMPDGAPTVHRAATDNVLLGELAACLAHGRGDLLGAVQYSKGLPDRPDVERVLRSAVNAGKLGDSPLASGPITTFYGDLKLFSAFDAALEWMQPVDFSTRRVVFVNGAPQGYIVGQGKPKPMTRIDFDDAPLAVLKAVGWLAVSKEFLSLGFVDGATKLHSELVKAVAATTDSEFFAQIAPSTIGSSTGDFLQDLRLLLASIPRHAGSALVLAAPRVLIDEIVTTPAVLQAGGLSALPLTAVVASDGLVPGTVGSPLVLFDATQIAGGAEQLELEASTEAAVMLDDAPSEGAQNLTGLWQNNLVGLRAERAFAVKAVRNAAAQIDDAAYPLSPGS